ncbi:MAG: GldG family protein [Chloroflexi bacterium]|nr:GldG family protein [Chloroflexota bacterium]
MSTSTRRPLRPQPERRGTLVSAVQGAIPTTARGVVSLILSIGGILGLFLGAIVLLFFPELRNTGYTVAAVGGILLLVGVMLSFNAIRQSVTARRGRYSTNTIVMIVAFILLATLVYVVASRNAVRWDTTATRQFSLASQTIGILGSLQEPIKATAFFVPGDSVQQPYQVPVENLLDEFRHRSGGRLSFEFVDPDVNPTLARRYGISQYPAVVFESLDSGRIYRLQVPLFQERDFASAILIVTGVERKQVYFLTGHAERPIDSTDPTNRLSMGLAANGLAADNYAVDTLAFAEIPLVPTDTAAIIMGGPRLELTETDATILHDYLKQGGRLMVLTEPNPPQSLKDFLAKWGVKANDGTIVDLGSSLAAQPQTPLIKKEQLFSNTRDTEEIAAPLDQVYFPGSASLETILPAEEMPVTIQLQPLARTTILSCLTLDPSVSTCPGAVPNVLFPAVVVRALAPINERPVQNAPRDARLVVIGDTDFASNFHLFSLSNYDLFLNSVNWLTEDISLAAVRPKPFVFRQLVVTAREMQLIRGMSWFVLPVTMAVLAGIAWWRRR